MNRTGELGWGYSVHIALGTYTVKIRGVGGAFGIRDDNGYGLWIGTGFAG